MQLTYIEFSPDKSDRTRTWEQLCTQGLKLELWPAYDETLLTLGTPIILFGYSAGFFTLSDWIIQSIRANWMKRDEK